MHRGDRPPDGSTQGMATGEILLSTEPSEHNLRIRLSELT